MLKDKNIYSLLLANIITIVLTLTYKQDIISVLWLYWWQSVVFCLLTAGGIMMLKRFSAQGIKPEMKDNETSTKMRTGCFFIVFYGIFHLVYALFIGFAFPMFIKHEPASATFMLTGIAVFAIHHFRELMYKNNNNAVPLLSNEFLKPFRRMIPMHLIIIFSMWIFVAGKITQTNAANFSLIVVFQILKTIVDVFSYQWWKKGKNITLTKTDGTLN